MAGTVKYQVSLEAEQWALQWKQSWQHGLQLWLLQAVWLEASPQHPWTFTSSSENGIKQRLPQTIAARTLSEVSWEQETNQVCFLIQLPPYPAHLQHGPCLALPVTPHRPALSGARHGAALPSGAQDSHPSPSARTGGRCPYYCFHVAVVIVEYLGERVNAGMECSKRKKKTHTTNFGIFDTQATFSFSAIPKCLYYILLGGKTR